MDFREESDSLGTVRVPAEAYYGAQTQRARENFPISGLGLPVSFLHSLALIKLCAAQANVSLGLIEREKGEAIVQAAQEAMDGKLDQEFVVDVFQTGSGTSTNMNLNEVLAARANEILTGRKASREPVHPNDHVNRCQSTNDAFPTALSITALRLIREKLQPSLESLQQELQAKAEAFAPIQKIGRTHLQDAVILSLGQEFSGYARQAELSLERLQGVEHRLKSLALGGTAVGTGANAHPDFAASAISRLADYTGLELFETPNHFESQGACDAAVELSGVLKAIAVSLSKIANDIRWLASGPRCGLGELNLPAVQPGSSIMPGKVNPVIPESLIQACAQVVGNDAAITCGGQGGYFELNTMLPLVAYNLIQSLELLSNGSREMASRCVRGITANAGQCEDNIRKSLALATYLAPIIGYDQAADIAHEAYASQRSVEEVARERKVLSEEQLQQVLYGRSTG